MPRRASSVVCCILEIIKSLLFLTETADNARLEFLFMIWQRVNNKLKYIIRSIINEHNKFVTRDHIFHLGLELEVFFRRFLMKVPTLPESAFLLAV